MLVKILSEEEMSGYGLQELATGPELTGRVDQFSGLFSLMKMMQAIALVFLVDEKIRPGKLRNRMINFNRESSDFVKISAYLGVMVLGHMLYTSPLYPSSFLPMSGVLAALYLYSLKKIAIHHVEQHANLASLARKRLDWALMEALNLYPGIIGIICIVLAAQFRFHSIMFPDDSQGEIAVSDFLRTLSASLLACFNMILLAVNIVSLTFNFVEFISSAQTQEKFERNLMNFAQAIMICRAAIRPITSIEAFLFAAFFALAMPLNRLLYLFKGTDYDRQVAEVLDHHEVPVDPAARNAFANAFAFGNAARGAGDRPHPEEEQANNL